MLKRFLILSSFIFSAGASANLLINGSFDEVTSGNSFQSIANAHQNPGTERYLDTLSESKNWGIFNALPGWITLPLLANPTNSIEVLHTGANTDGTASTDNDVKAHSEGLFIEFDLDRDGGLNYNSALGQSLFGLVNGQAYELSFFYQPRTGNANDNGVALHVFDGDITGYDAQSTSVLVADSNTNDWQNETDKDSKGWKEYTYSFIATSSEMSVAFSGLGTANGQGGFIDSASLIAVSEPAYLFVIGLGLMGMRIRKKK